MKIFGYWKEKGSLKQNHSESSAAVVEKIVQPQGI